MNENRAFDFLCAGVQKAIFDKGWKSLHPIQEDSIRAVFQSADHLLISAQTAGGKTEAAFLPIISKISERQLPSVQALYVGPLKALINDQFQRMQTLCEDLGIPVHRWHGDVGVSEKTSIVRQPEGILLITPESLEAIFVRRGRFVRPLFSSLEYVVIDELHSFLDNVRGIHLQSLIARIRSHAGCAPRMAGLSATLGDYEAAKRFLDIDDPWKVRLIENPTTTRQIKLGMKAFVRPLIDQDDDKKETYFGVPLERVPSLLSRLDKSHFKLRKPLAKIFSEDEKAAYALPRPDDLDVIARDIALKFATSTNLVFCNSKSTVELLTDRLRRLSSKSGAPVDPFVVHHASLSRSQRDDAEERLKSSLPTTAICSSTLEMGIDISGIKAVGQVQAPWTVSSMLQRLGRSGREQGEPAILRSYTRDFTPHCDCTLTDLLFPDLIQSIAMVELMLAKWIEPPDVDDLNLSTLVHQILSHLTQTGGMTAQDLFDALVKAGPFRRVTPDIFQRVLKSMFGKSLLDSLPPNLIVVGIQGEFLTSARDFYAAFMGEEEFSVEYQDESIGKIPPDRVPPKGENLLLGGRRWIVTDVIQSEMTVVVVPSRNLTAPHFSSIGMGCGDRIAQQMKLVLERDDVPAYLDENGGQLLGFARRVAELSGAVGNSGPIPMEDGIRFFPWAGSKIHTTLWCLAKSQGLTISTDTLSLHYRNVSAVQLREHFDFILKSQHDPTTLAKFLPVKAIQKFDGYLADDLLDLANGRRLLEISRAVVEVQRTVDAW